MARIFNQQSILIELSGMFNARDMTELMIIYGLGATSIFFVLMLMYRYALKNSHLLQLNKIEEFDTRNSMNTNLLMGIIPLLSVILAVLFKNHMLGGMISGFTYFLYPPVMFVYSIRREKRRKSLLREAWM